jgi:hypothetical protein
MDMRKSKTFAFVLALIVVADLVLALSGWQISVRDGGRVIFPGEKFIYSDYKFINGDQPSLVCRYFNGRSRVWVIYPYGRVWDREKCPIVVRANGKSQ